MSIEALWTVDFVSNQGIGGGGVVIFDTERIFGGDGSYYYVGKYSIKDEEVTGIIDVKRYNPHLPSVFSELGDFSLELKGKLAPPHAQFIATGHVVGMPSLSIEIHLKRQSELP